MLRVYASKIAPRSVAELRGRNFRRKGHLCARRFFHSVTLRPGLSPWTRSAQDVERLYAKIDGYLDGLSQTACVRFVTVSEACHALGFGAPGLQASQQSVTGPC